MAAPHYSTERQRYTRQHPCPICGGDERDERGQGKRCAGFTTASNIYCTRDQYAGDLPLDESTNPASYRHWRYGKCPCGIEHNPSQKAASENTSQKQQWYGRLVATYDYQDKDGKPLFQVRRYDPKRFVQGHFDAQHKWVWNLQGVDLVLYRLPELLKSGDDEVWIVEGEKDVDNLRAVGLTATCNPMGALKWRRDYGEWLRGRRVVILPDNDDETTKPPFAGQKHAQQVARFLSGVAASVKVVTLPADKGKDVSDYLKAGGTIGELRGMAQEAKEWTPESQQKERTEEKCSSPEELLARLVFNVDDLLAKEFPPIRETVAGIIFEGLTLFAGKPKMGKSWFMLAIALAIASGGYALGKIKVDAGDVLYLGLEDRQKRLQNRLLQIGAAQGKNPHFQMATEWPRLGEGGLELLEAWIKQHPEARLIVIDTLAKIKPRSNGKQRMFDEDYQSLEPLQALSMRTDVPIVVITHLRKMSAEDPFDEISGSLGLNGAADNMLVLRKERGKEVATLYGTGRDGDEIEKAVKFDRQRCTWTLEGNADEYAATKERREIVKVLKQVAPRRIGPKEIADRLQKKENNIKQLLYKMIDAGEVIKDGRGLYTIPGNYDNQDNFASEDRSEPESDEDEKVTGYPPNDNFEEEEMEEVTDDESDNFADNFDEARPQGAPDEKVIEVIEVTDDEYDNLTDTGKQRVINFQEELKKRQRSFSEDDLDASTLNLIEDDTRLFLESWLPYKILEDPFAWLRGYVARIGYQVLSWAGTNWGGTRSTWERELSTRMDHVTAKLMAAHFQALEGGV